MFFYKSIAILIFCYLQLNYCNYVKPGPSVKPTAGEVWPKPVEFEINPSYYYKIVPENFKIISTNNNCPILEEAIQRYTRIILNQRNSLIRAKPIKGAEEKFLEQMNLKLASKCEEYPHANMDESYEISIRNKEISAKSIWGILRGLETFSQLIKPLGRDHLYLAEVEITDYPRFQYRGLMLDTSRHFISIKKILSILDGMEYNKLNVFHWHIVDDQSFPYQSDKYPELAKKGAYNSHMIYTTKHVAEIVEYARLRGIRVIPEFDVPGHSASWGASHPELLTKCYGKYEGQLGPMNPIKKETYSFIEDLFSEIFSLYSDKNFHLGGDEVDEGCWESNQEIIDYVKEHNIDYPDLGKIFVENFSKFLKSNNRTTMVWQEAICNGIELPADAIVEVWFDWQSKVAKLTSENYKVILTECWYLHVLDTGGDWEKFYNCEPHNFEGTENQRKLVIGGEAAMWTEVVNDFNVIQRIFPRTSAVAERLWSPKSMKISNNVQKRLEEQVCRMILRGVESQPANDPGFC